MGVLRVEREITHREIRIFCYLVGISRPDMLTACIRSLAVRGLMFRPSVKLWAASFSGIAVGIVIGAVTANHNMKVQFRPTLEQLLITPFGNASLRVLIDVRALTKIQGGDPRGATEDLEIDLDQNLYTLASYEDVVPSDWRSEATYKVLKSAATYRRDHPRLSRSESRNPAESVIAKALSLGDRHASAP